MVVWSDLGLSECVFDRVLSPFTAAAIAYLPGSKSGKKYPFKNLSLTLSANNPAIGFNHHIGFHMNGFAQTNAALEFSQDELQFQNVDLTLFGRFMREDKNEFPCQIKSMSAGSATIVTPNIGYIGERIIAYVDHLGRLEGKILRVFNGGFAMSVNATTHKRDKLAAKITWLANRHELSLPEDRRHERLEPKRSLTMIKLEDGRNYSARILDLSLSGAAVQLEVRPAIGTLIWLGNMRGRVVRHFDEGVAIEFAILQTHDTLRDFIA